MIPRTAIQLQTETSLRARISPVEIGPERDLQRSNHWSQVDAPKPTGVQWFHQLIGLRMFKGKNTGKSLRFHGKIYGFP